MKKIFATAFAILMHACFACSIFIVIDLLFADKASGYSASLGLVFDWFNVFASLLLTLAFGSGTMTFASALKKPTHS